MAADERWIRLDDRRLTTAEAVNLSGVNELTLRNWTAPGRGILVIGEKQFGRLTFTLLDVVKLAAMVDLTQRVPLKPSDAAGLAELLRREVEKRSPMVEGHPVADPSAIPRGLALTVTFHEGEAMVGLIDPAQPEYTALGSQYARAHIVVPIAALLVDVLFRMVALPTSGVAR